jgi:transglutaminase-like putative cysteine protease
MVTGESHAWVEWWDGGWCAFDPTNSTEVGTRHVTLGRGRDYGDVPPFKGIFSGPGSEGHTVTVEVTRLA